MSKEKTPQQLASEHLFGDSDYVPAHPDLPFPDPRNKYGPRVSWNELVQRYSMCRVLS